MSDLGDRFFNSLIKSKNLDEYMRLGNIGYLFNHVKSDKKTYDEFSSFVSKYGKIPSKKTFTKIIGRELRKSNEPAKYYFDEMLVRHIKSSLIKAGQDANEALNNQKDVFKAFNILQSEISQIGLDQIQPKLYEFNAQAHDLLKYELKKKKSLLTGVYLGWASFDEMSGTLRGGDVVSFVGRPAAGKTFMVLNAALNMNRKQKKKVLFVSMEMKPIIIFERLAAMDMEIPYNWVKHGDFPTHKFKSDKSSKDKFFNHLFKLSQKHGPEFWIVDGELTASVEDVANLAMQLKPDVVVIDGAYLLELNNGKYFKEDNQKVGKVCEIIKNRIATALDIPVIASWQLNRESTKIKKTEKAGVEHIAFSDKIGQLSSLVLGLFQMDSVETLKQREIRIMKGRSGETGEFTINWNFTNMCFDEVEKIKDFEVQIT